MRSFQLELRCGTVSAKAINDEWCVHSAVDSSRVHITHRKSGGVLGYFAATSLTRVALAAIAALPPDFDVPTDDNGHADIAYVARLTPWLHRIAKLIGQYEFPTGDLESRRFDRGDR